LVSNPDARRKVIDQELVETAKLFKGPEFDRRTVLDFEATPVTSGSDDDGPRERKVNTSWRLDDRGVFSDSHGELLTSGLGWAVWTDGRVKFTTGGGLPFKTRDIPVAPDITGLLRSGVLAPGSHLALVTRRGKVLRIDPAAVNPQGAAGNGVAGVKLAADGDEVIAALPLTCENGEAILSISEKGWKVTEVADIPVKGRGGAGVGFHPFVNGEGALLSAAVSATGFVRGKRAVRAENRAKASVKGSGGDVTPAG
jgi:DNA gyrase subunit A